MLASLRASLVLPLILCAAVTSLTAQPGTLSSSFGANGLLTDPSRQAFEKAVLSQPDKKILIGSQGFYQGYQTFMVDRLLPDGTKDSLFGVNGTAYVLFRDQSQPGNLSSEIDAIALLPDGKIIAAGHAMGNGKNIAITRLLPDGKPDSSFGSNGTSLTGFNFDETLAALAIQPDGRIAIGGSTQVSPSPADFRFFTARYLSDGIIDSSFGNKGITVSLGTGRSNAMLVQPDGKIVAAGYISTMDGTRFHLERYNANGSYDKSFGAGGTVSTNPDGTYLNFLNDVVLQPDGKLVAAGRTNLQSFTLIRYNSDGTPDDGFGKDGLVTLSLPDANGEARKVMLTAKGDRILAAGSLFNIHGSDFILASWLLSGIPDTSFGNGGMVTTDFGGSDFANTAARCADGSIIVLGSNAGRYPFTVRALAKYNGYPASVSLFVKIKRWLQNHTITWNGLLPEEKIIAYKIEQSSNGKTGFAEIGSVSGASQAKEYSFTNSRLLAGANYYRIKAIHADGSVKYSETVSVNDAASAVSVYPNPAKDVIVIKGLNANGVSNLSVAGDNGKVMMRVVSRSNIQYRMTVSSLQKGEYYLTVTAPDGSVETRMFVKE